MNTLKSDKNAAFLASIFKHMKTKPDVDWEAVTAEMGLKNIKVTQTRYGQIKNQLQAAAAGTLTKVTPTKKVKRGRSPAVEDDDADVKGVEAENATLAKKGVKGRKRAKTIFAQDAETTSTADNGTSSSGAAGDSENGTRVKSDEDPPGFGIYEDVFVEDSDEEDET